MIGQSIVTGAASGLMIGAVLIALGALGVAIPFVWCVAAAIVVGTVMGVVA